jgi:uncharacterized RmlC-like cupin family protein
VAETKEKWKYDGVRVVKSTELDTNTPQTPGMNRAAAITYARCGAEKLWAGTVVIHANAKTGAHHHGPVESVIYVVKGKARMRWGEQLEFVAEAGPGDFIHVPPYVPQNQRLRGRRAVMRAVSQRSGPGGGEPGYPGRGETGASALGRQYSSQPEYWKARLRRFAARRFRVSPLVLKGNPRL